MMKDAIIRICLSRRDEALSLRASGKLDRIPFGRMTRYSYKARCSLEWRILVVVGSRTGCPLVDSIRDDQSWAPSKIPKVRPWTFLGRTRSGVSPEHVEKDPNHRFEVSVEAGLEFNRGAALKRSTQQKQRVRTAVAAMSVTLICRGHP